MVPALERKANTASRERGNGTQIRSCPRQFGNNVAGGQGGSRRPAGFPIEDVQPGGADRYHQHGSPLVHEAYLPVAVERVERADGQSPGEVPEPQALPVAGPTAAIADRQRFAVGADGQLVRHAGLLKDAARLAALRIEEHGLPNAADDQGPAVGSECQAQDKAWASARGAGQRPVAVS